MASIADEKDYGVQEHTENRVDDPVHTKDHSGETKENAYKGDDSDGKIDWTFRSALAMAFLSALYTG